MSRAVRVRDLKRGQNGVIQKCTHPECEAEYSADAGDYWDWEPDKIMKCLNPVHGPRNVILARKVTRFVKVSP